MSSSKVQVPGGEIWYALHGDFKPAKTPLVLIHGGPGFSSAYFSSFVSLASQDLPVLIYDQLGSGKSACVDNPELWSVERFREELKSLLDFLKIEKAYLLGHSWGAVIAHEFVLSYPEQTKAIIFASPALSIPLWREDVIRLKKKLGFIENMILNEAERSEDLFSSAYIQTLNKYYTKFIYGMEPLVPELQVSVQDSNPRLYQYMWGPNEIIINGTLKDYDAREALKEHNCPMLFTCGRSDEVTPESCETLSACVPGSKVEVFEHSAHHPQITERELYWGRLKAWIENQCI